MKCADHLFSFLICLTIFRITRSFCHAPTRSLLSFLFPCLFQLALRTWTVFVTILSLFRARKGFSSVYQKFYNCLEYENSSKIFDSSFVASRIIMTISRIFLCTVSTEFIIYLDYRFDGTVTVKLSCCSWTEPIKFLFFSRV